MDWTPDLVLFFYDVSYYSKSSQRPKIKLINPSTDVNLVLNKSCDSDSGSGEVEVAITAPDGTRSGVPVQIEDRGNGTSRCYYTPENTGVHRVNVNFGGEPLPNSPYKVEVVPCESYYNEQNIQFKINHHFQKWKVFCVLFFCLFCFQTIYCILNWLNILTISFSFRFNLFLIRKRFTYPFCSWGRTPAKIRVKHCPETRSNASR